jgi:hypothetical protein
MNCENCPVGDLCGGNPLTLVVKLTERYGDLLAMLVALNTITGASVITTTLSGFCVGYVTRVAEEIESPSVDMDVWGECFKEAGDADSQT